MVSVTDFRQLIYARIWLALCHFSNVDKRLVNSAADHSDHQTGHRHYALFAASALLSLRLGITFPSDCLQFAHSLHRHRCSGTVFVFDRLHGVRIPSVWPLCSIKGRRCRNELLICLQWTVCYCWRLLLRRDINNTDARCFHC